MLCEQCLKEVEAAACEQCGATVLQLGPFCYMCGKEFDKLRSPEEKTESAGDDFSCRVLCSDGTCIGVVDEKGFCKVCGKPYSPETI